ncbi:hypothetical protein [Candidatus Liberibacter brunswickensis]|uniref:hypothetical protein n=1 Tax=Candidatus Liberibacter brunswickensis TaxID=1968796 RepID=UPI002FDFBAA1
MDAILSRLEDFSIVSSLSEKVGFSDTTNVDLISSPCINYQKERDKAYQEGYNKAVNDLELHWKSKNNSIKQSYENEIADLRELLESCTSKAISVAVRDCFKCFSNSLESEAIRILKSILDIGFSNKAAIEFSRIIIDSLKKGHCGKIVIHCPKNFHSLIEELLGDYSPMVCYEDSNTVEFYTKISDSLITTQLESWSSDVKRKIEIQKAFK